MERVKGIEPSSQAWEARILPLNHTRKGVEVLYQSFPRHAIAQIRSLQLTNFGAQ